MLHRARFLRLCYCCRLAMIALALVVEATRLLLSQIAWLALSQAKWSFWWESLSTRPSALSPSCLAVAIVSRSSDQFR